MVHAQTSAATRHSTKQSKEGTPKEFGTTKQEVAHFHPAFRRKSKTLLLLMLSDMLNRKKKGLRPLRDLEVAL